MGYSGADKDELRDIAVRLHTVERDLDGITTGVRSIATDVSRNPSLNKLGYARMIREASSSTEKSAKMVSAFSSGLERVADLYESYENRVIASPFDESSNGIGGSSSSRNQRGGLNPFLGLINEGDGSSTTKKTTVMKAVLDYLKEAGGGKAGNYLGLLGGLTGFYESWMDMFTGNCEYGAKKTYFDVCKNSVDTWKSMYDIFADHFSHDNDFGTGIYSRVGQTTAGAFGLTASAAGIASTIYELINTQHQNGWVSAKSSASSPAA